MSIADNMYQLSLESKESIVNQNDANQVFLEILGDIRKASEKGSFTKQVNIANYLDPWKDEQGDTGGMIALRNPYEFSVREMFVPVIRLLEKEGFEVMEHDNGFVYSIGWNKN